MSEQKQFIDIRTLSLGHIVALKEEKHERFREVISSSFSGHEFSELKQRILQGKTPNNDLKIKLQLDYIETVLEKCKEVVEENESGKQKLADATAVYQIALEVFEKAKEALREAEEELEAVKSSQGVNLQDLEEINRQIEEARKDLQKKKRLILVHPSTSFKQIIEYKDGILYATSIDAKVLKQIGCVDKIFDGGVSFVDVIPSDIRRKYSEEELFSIICYANMVINTVLSEEDVSSYKLLYSNKDIDTILKVNGFDL